MFDGSPQHLTFSRYEIMSPQRRYAPLDVALRYDCFSFVVFQVKELKFVLYFVNDLSEIYSMIV